MSLTAWTRIADRLPTAQTDGAFVNIFNPTLVRHAVQVAHVDHVRQSALGGFVWWAAIPALPVADNV